VAKFATLVIKWQKQHGRHGLPWQGTRDPYRVWLSEIMLQQTQVSTVIDYYLRFLKRFPTIAALAEAPSDDVMQHWAGLGYYARARNLHRAAQAIVAQHGGIFPKDFAAINALSGIGRSTAAAISAFAFGQRAAILDGNVKRVFARHFGVAGDVKTKAVENMLWTRAEAELPKNDIEAYTQGLMDLGATLCTRTKPTCLLCPIQASCVAYAEGRIEALPGKSAKREVPHREVQMLILLANGDVLLEKRPPTGIWGGLWSLPEIDVAADAMKVARTRFAVKAGVAKSLAIVEHGFTHYSLSIYPQQIVVTSQTPRAMESSVMWIALEDALGAAIPAPVKRILTSINVKKSGVSPTLEALRKR
jgi:A/G-specific adenine glycosylase